MSNANKLKRLSPLNNISIFIAITLLSLVFQQMNFGQVKDVLELSGNTKGWFEGFEKNLGNNQFAYFSFRSDITKGLLTRCTNGEMTIKWETAKLPSNWTKPKAGFVWLAAINLTTQPGTFGVYINGVKRFEIIASKQKNWILRGKDGGKLSFTNVETDQYGDAHGYMSLLAPTKWLKKGQGQIISITGNPAGQSTWMIVFQANDALSYLHNSVANDAWMEIDLAKKNYAINAHIQAPITLANKTVECNWVSNKKSVRLSEKNNSAVGEFILPLSAMKKPFEVDDSHGKIFAIKSLGQNSKSIYLLGKSILINKSKSEDNKIILTAQRNYKPKLVSDLVKVCDSNLSNGKIYLMNSSHQDIAWMDSPEKCEIERDTMLVTPLLKKLEKDTSYRFDLEESLILKEYIKRHPNKKNFIETMLTEGRISCGANYTQPYEDMYSGESLCRQLYFGKKWLKDEFGYNATVYWSEDVPGRTPQMMQILSKVGVKYMMISRMQKGFYKWYSPDGSYVTMFSPGQYADAFTPLQKGFYDASSYLASNSLYWKKFYSPEKSSPVIPVLSDWDMSPAKDYGQLISKWENIDERETKNGDFENVHLPKFKITTAPGFFKTLLSANPKLKRISGERPDVWVYIHGPSHEKALTASREGDIFLTEAEKFATANALVDGTFRNYPEAELRKAWEAKVYPDHGWGGKNGDITDDTFRRKFDFAKSEGEKILEENLNDLSSKIKTDPKRGRPLIVFNGMNEDRTDPVSVIVRFDEGKAHSIKLFDSKDMEVKTQLSEEKNYADGSIKSAKLHFIAKDVPPIGYKTYYVQPEKKNIYPKTMSFSKEVENKFYKLRFTNGGLSSIYDKKLNAELINPKEFAAGEVFTLHSEGNGAGEFADIQQPDTSGFDKTGNYKTQWRITENGDVYTTYEYWQKIRYAVVVERVILYHQLKRIDFDVDLMNWQGVLYREFRMALPLNITKGQVSYEVPFGAVEVGKGELKGAAGERYQTPCSQVHPRSIQNWISASGTKFGVTMSSSVAAADWIDPVNKSTSYPILQPILLASRKSCNPEGNEYLQTGNHYYRFSITSHKPGWLKGESFGRGANENLIGIWADHHYASVSLPESMSFFGTDSSNVLISTVKKAEDHNAVIVRIVDFEGKDRKVDFHSFQAIHEAKHTNIIEDEEEPMQASGDNIQFKLGHNAIETFEFK